MKIFSSNLLMDSRPRKNPLHDSPPPPPPIKRKESPPPPVKK